MGSFYWLGLGILALVWLLLSELRFFYVDGWLAHGDYACGVNVDFFGVVEHYLIPAKVRHVWSRLHKDGIHSVWSLASQKHSHVDQAGVGVVLLLGWGVVGVCIQWLFLAIREPVIRRPLLRRGPDFLAT